MQLLEQTPKGAGNEIQLTDAIALLQQKQAVEAYRMQGQTFDCGSKLVTSRQCYIMGLIIRSWVQTLRH